MNIFVSKVIRYFLQTAVFATLMSNFCVLSLELGYAKSAIRNILSRVSLKRPLYVNLFMWMKKLDMNSFENPQLPRKRGMDTCYRGRHSHYLL